MNPWALLVILLGLMLIIIGIKGTQHDIAAAITGKAITASGGGKNQNPVPFGGQNGVSPTTPPSTNPFVLSGSGQADTGA